MLYETLLSKLGSRMTLNFRPHHGQARYSPLGRYYDGPLDFRLGVRVGDEVRYLPFTREEPRFTEIEQHLTMTTVLYRATWREKGLRVEFEFLSPFYPQDEQLSTAPLLYLRVSLKPLKLYNAEPVEEAEVLVEMDWAAEQAGVTDLTTEVAEGELRRSFTVDLGKTEIATKAFFHQDLDPIPLQLRCQDILHASGPQVTSSAAGFRFQLRVDGEPGEIAWVSHTPDPILLVRGEATPFKYTQFFASADEVLNYALEQREEIFERTRFFDSLFTEASFTAAERDLHAFGFQSYLANTWWTLLPDQQDWYSVWEGCCLFHSTVDVEYNQAPFYLLFWPRLLELELDAWADYALPHPEVAGRFVSHDIGLRHEISGQTYAHPMEVEENTNYLLLLFSHWRVTADASVMERHWDLVHDLIAFLADADRSGNGFPEVGTANTIDDASPAVQFSRQQTYLAVKTASACQAAAVMAAHLDDEELKAQCDDLVQRLDRTLQEEAWLGDHYAVCIDKGLTRIDDPWNPDSEGTEYLDPEGRIHGWDAYSLYTSLGLLQLLMTDTELPLSDPSRLRADIVRVVQESRGPYGCFHSSEDHSNMWVSSNLHRDFVAAYLGLDLITPHSGLYWNFELHQNGPYGRGGCFTDSYGGNFLHYYPRGLTSLGMLTALGGITFDRVAGTVTLAPVRLPLRLPLVQVADWPARRVPWLYAEIGKHGADVEISSPDLFDAAGVEWV
ncbi:MAG: DUF4965 domain-containing protein [candidate division WS1 bacterium]|jgi:hypothetical protein|nr:DUF4965 domain-containing protein [candidate division WS1 bacterium]